ncbi:MAG: alpha/beta hydrolase [Ktedonobacteraceae bacterium]|nr:alpha/beta hydrolase [Ktedonobacteraceae bacterium]MBO0792789.1 alpha/beta hydrolase [Ktedonobacteraceae bacterium]
MFGVSAYIVDVLTRPKRLASFYDIYTFTPFELNLPAEEVTFDPISGTHKVSGWYVPHPRATTTIIMCPGYRGKRADMLGLCGQLWKRGHNVLVFEYYGHGAVVGKPVTLGYREINDFMGAVAYARQRAPHARLGAVGFSMGASVSIMACARTTEVEALVCDSAFATHRSAIAYAVRRTLHLPFAIFDWVTDLLLWLRAGYHFYQVEPLRDIERLAPRPVLLIHGARDTIVDPRDAPLLYEKAGEPKELWLLPEADHCGAYFEDRTAYIKKVADFFDLHLRRSRSPLSLQERKTGWSSTGNPSAEAS